MPDTIIDYHALAGAQFNYADEEADRLISQIPSALASHPAYAVPERGAYGVTGAERLRVAERALRLSTAEAERVADLERIRSERWASAEANRERAEARIKLGLPQFLDELPPNYPQLLAKIERGEPVGTDIMKWRAEQREARKAERGLGML
jgi:hypothetical protein